MKSAQVPSAWKEQKLEMWIREYSTQLLRICFVYLSDRDQAQDALQDAFLKAWRSMDKYEKRQVQIPPITPFFPPLCIDICSQPC